ncbi:winged helix-turn-helix transcriptional regulator [Saccharothrix sp. HUAS TT1]|uniref:winged helix-turn-helix transcriptional regulator n=1 Tax=Saccharothrix sp. HUAS TT1 TaxID=3231910 RepID=UPI00345B8E82
MTRSPAPTSARTKARPTFPVAPVTTITPKVLTQRLRQLERDGLVVRTYHPEVPPGVEYEIKADQARFAHDAAQRTGARRS